MKSCHPSLVFLATISLVAQSRAVTVIDWWSLSNGELRNDVNSVVGIYSVMASAGTPSPVHPLAHPYNGIYWDSPPEFTDSLLGTATLPGYDFLTTPSASGFSYSVTLTSTQLDGAFLALGNLSPLSGTTIRIIPADATASPLPAPIMFLEERTWDAGFVPNDAPLLWSAASNTLSVASGGSNDSGMAWFQLPNAGVFSVTLEISGSSAIPIGDTVSVAIGAIPEPSFAFLASLGAFFALNFRQRKHLL